MDTLPADLCHDLLHTFGPHARLVCRRWRAAYGPLSLSLSHLPSTRDLRSITRPRGPPDAPPPFAYIHTLRLDPPYHPSIIPHLPSTFPALRSLHLRTQQGLPTRPLTAFAPWHPTLTALTITQPPDAPAAALLTSFTALRSLTLLPPSPPYTSLDLSDTLTALRPLPLLQHFHWQGPSHAQPDSSLLYSCADQLLPALAGGLPNLTHLTLSDLRLARWSAVAVHTLATAWPALAALHIHIHPAAAQDGPALDHPASPDDIMAALARRTALTSLAINAHPALPYHHLHPRRLRNLAIHQDHDDHATLPRLLPAVAASGTLTRLSVRAHGTLDFTPTLGAELALLACSLRALELRVQARQPGSLAALSVLTGLRALSLELLVPVGEDAQQEGPFAEAGPLCAALAQGLTSLTSLTTHGRLHAQRDPNVGWANLRHNLVCGLAAAGRLRDVQLLECFVQPFQLPLMAAPMAQCLVRLHICVYHETHMVVRAICLLAGMVQLRHLEVQPWLSLRHLAVGTSGGGSSIAGGVVRCGSSTGRDTAGPSDAVGAAEEAAARAAAAAAAAVAAAAREMEEVVLPPRLRVLVVDLCALGPRQQELLCAAAAAQECAIWLQPRPVDGTPGDKGPHAA